MGIHITIHRDSGKMRGLKSISTSTLDNPFCQQMPTPVCQHCYARRFESYRPTLYAALHRNGEILSSGVLPRLILPRFEPGEYVRFNSFGELINEHHLTNLVQICLDNPETHFALWTKRLDLLPRKRYWTPKPANLQVIWSWGELGTPPQQLLDSRLHPWVDRIFAVYTKSGPHINCKRQCINCLACYRPDSEPKLICELLR